MTHEGPQLETLLRRMAETPAEFLMEPRVGSSGVVHVPAVVADLYRELGGATKGPPALTPFQRGEDPVSALLPEHKHENEGMVGRLLSRLTSKKEPEEKLTPQEREWLRCVLVACWLLIDDWFVKRGALADAALAFLQNELREIAASTNAKALVNDADRREELVRTCLKALDMRPEGESKAQAQDRLATLNTAERMRLLKAVREAEERARKIREAMAQKAAAEAAAKYNRE
jgi:hypothetical protein